MNNMQALNAQPLKCILTNSKKSIELLKSTGSLIVYDPNNTEYKDYHELYLANMFLAGGYGAYSQIEQNNLHYISNAYNDILLYLNNKDKLLAEEIKSSYFALDSKKVDKKDGNVSETLTSINDDDELIRVKDLFKIFTNFPQYKNLEITSISYKITVNENDNEYVNVNNSNIIEIPIGCSIKSIAFTITGNIHNSGGIKEIDLVINDINNENTEQPVKISDLSILGKYETDGSFTINFIKIFDEANYQQITTDIEYTLIKSFIISVNATPITKYLSIDNEIVKTFAKHDVIIKTGAIEDNEIQIDPLIIKGVYPLYYSFDDNGEESKKIISYDFLNDSDDIKVNIIRVNSDENQKIKKISIYVPVQYTIVNAIYTNIVNSTVINITNYFVINHEESYHNNDCYKYDLTIIDPTEKYYKSGDPIKQISIINAANINDLYFYKGFITLTITGPLNNINYTNEFNDDYLSNNWLYWTPVDDKFKGNLIAITNE